MPAAIRRSLPHGHVAALLGLATQLGLPRILNRKPCRQRDLALAAVIARLIHPASKLATARALSPETADSSLGALLGLGGVSGNELLDMLDWLSNRQPWIEQSLSRRHLPQHHPDPLRRDLDLPRGAAMPVGRLRSQPRRKEGEKADGLSACSAPLTAVRSRSKSFPGNTADPTTLAAQVRKIRDRFAVRRVALVGDRGMITSARIRNRSVTGRPGLDSRPCARSTSRQTAEGPQG